jgi:multidrug efflux pump subunit AcrB
VIAWFVKNRVAANLLFLGISLGGLLTVRGIPQEMIPETETSAVAIRTVFPGAAAEVVEDGVLLRLEEALREVSGVEEIAGMAAEGLGLVTVTMESGGDLRSFSNEIREQVESLSTLPEDAEEPVISEVVVERLLLRIAVHGNADERTLVEAAHLARETISSAPGVGKVEIASGREYEISIGVSEDLLTRFGLTFDRVAAAIRRGSGDIAGGSLRTKTGDVNLRTEAEAGSAADFERIPLIASPGGGLVTIGDVATVADEFADVQRTARMNGEPAVFLEVLLAPEARMLDTAQAVHARIPEIANALPEGLSVTTWFDSWELFESRMEVLMRNGLQGLALIFMVLFFTMSSRLAVWTAAGLPVSFFGAFLLMPGLGATISMFSLFGFILTLGIVVDDAIVVGENVQRRIAEKKLGTVAAAVRGTRQVLVPATFGVLTTMAAFAPLLGLPGVWGELMGVLPRIVIPVLAFSLLDAAWILPHHMAHGGIGIRPSHRLAQIRAGFQRGIDWTVDALYCPALVWSLRNRFAAVAAGIVLVAAALGLLGGGWVPVEPTPPFDADLVTIQVELPPGAPVGHTAEAVAALEAEIARLREDQQNRNGVDPQRHLAVLVGQRLPFGPGGPIGGKSASSATNIGQVTLELVPAEQQVGFSTGAIADRLREFGRQLPHRAEATVISSVLGQVADISIRISGADREELEEGSAHFQDLMEGYAGVISVWDDLEGSTQGLVARVRSGSAGVGVGAVEFGRQLRQAFHGEEIQRIQRGRDEVRVVLRYPRGEGEDLDRMAGMRVRRADGGVAPLSEVAEISREEGPAVVQRVDGRRAVTVHASVDPAIASAGALLADLRARTLPNLHERFPALRFEVVGLAGDQEETFAALSRNLMLALILIFALLAIPLSSWIQPFVIMTAVPFGLAGAIFGHQIMGVDLSMVSFFGMVPLVGIVVNDALVLLDFINQKRREGAPMFDAALAAGRLRFRPVILTSVTTCAGLAPLMIERSAQAQVLIPMAVSLSFGVAFATLITLLLVPVLYSLAEHAGARPGGRR